MMMADRGLGINIGGSTCRLWCCIKALHAPVTENWPNDPDGACKQPCFKDSVSCWRLFYRLGIIPHPLIRSIHPRHPHPW